MKIIVTVKAVVDPAENVRIAGDHFESALAELPVTMNPLCETALEESVRLKEQQAAAEVLAVSVGGAACHDPLRLALALGADRAVHIRHKEALAPLQVAKLLKILVEEEQPGLVILGMQSVDQGHCQTGPMLAALCDMPQGTFASQVTVEEGFVRVRREVDGGRQTLRLRLPAVVTASQRLNTPRRANLPAIMAAKRKPLLVREAADMGVSLDSRLTLVKVEPPPPRPGCVMVDSVAAMVEKLRQEAKVI